jgi:hypothetical protein
MLTKLWAEILLVYIMGLPRFRRTFESKETNAIQVITDHFTIIVRCFAVTKKIDTLSLAEVLVVKLVFKAAGFLECIISYPSLQLTLRFQSS